MTSRVNHWKLGLFVLVGIAAGIGFLTWLGVQRLDRETHTAYAYFDESVHGLSVGSTVEFRGVPIGHVADFTIAPDKRHVEVRAELYVDRMKSLGFDPQNLEREGLLPQGLRVQLISNPLTGTSFIQADFFRDGSFEPPQYSFEVKPNTVPSAPSTFKSLEANLVDTLNAIPPLADAATGVLTKLDRELGEGLHLRELTQELREAVATVRDRVAGIEQMGVVKEARAAFAEAQRATAEIRQLVDDWYSDEGPFKTFSREYRELAARLRTALDDLQVAETGAALRDAGRETAGLSRELRSHLGALRRAVDAVERLAAMLERDPGALLRGKAATERPGKED